MSCKCSGASEGERVDFQYAVKIVCGLIKISDQPPNPLPPGRYSTATNVHNPSRCDTVVLRWKVAIGLPGLKVGPISSFAEASLGPDEALEIDCSDVMARLKRDGVPLPAYVKGWVIIECPSELDVVAVYGTSTASGDAPVSAPVNAFHTERVEPRCLPICDDFVLDISTGVADWYVKGPAIGAGFAQATLSSATSPWAQPPGGSRWVIPGNLTSDGEYTYRLRFKLCSGFRKPSLSLQLLADYFANVFLNGHQIPPVQTAAGGPNFTTLIPFTTNSFFKAGDNELIVVVNNTERLSPTGLALHGSIEIENGRCAGVPYPLLVCPEIRYYLHTRTFYFNPFPGLGFVDIDRGTSYGQNGQQLGDTSGKVRAEEFGAALQGVIAPGTSLEYEVFTKSVSGTTGWVSPPAPGGMAGIAGPDHAITALRIRLVNAPVHCHVKYSVATRPRLAKWDPNVTWGPDTYDWGIAGTTASVGWPGQFPPVVAVKVEIVYL
jgi:hypothetical protein